MNFTVLKVESYLVYITVNSVCSFGFPEVKRKTFEKWSNIGNFFPASGPPVMKDYVRLILKEFKFHFQVVVFFKEESNTDLLLVFRKLQVFFWK